MKEKYPKVAQLRTVDRFQERLKELNLTLPCDSKLLRADEGSPLAQPLALGGKTLGNRWCIHPMEGWDANTDGSPSDLTLRRWRRFGESGAKLIWGGEAAAVQPDGRANPNQTLATASNETGLRQLLMTLKESHHQHHGTTDDLIVGLQLTHSGRFCKPNDHKKLEPRIAYHHPLLDAKFNVDPTDDRCVWTDADLERLIDRYVDAAKLASKVGFDFVDVKACHGYLLHEFLSARQRPGKFGGDFDGRSRMLLTIIDRIRQECPSISVGVRLSVFDMLPFQQDGDVGTPMAWATGKPYPFGFGNRQDDPMQIDLDEPIELLNRLQRLGVIAVNLSCGSPYYNPHIQRPAIFPPSDGYQPPEDPLVGVCRQIQCVATVKRHFPNLPLVGSGYTYLQDFLPLVAQAVVREKMVDIVGLGRMVLSYPQLPADALKGTQPERKLVCRTFSECTTAPRNAMISGCFPLDEFYKQRPERQIVQDLKRKLEE